MNNNDKIICPRCSMEMKKNSRYCMKCGYLNYDHPENFGMKAEVRQNVRFNRNYELRFGSNTGSKKICFFINIILYVLFLVFIYMLYSSKYN